MTVYYTTAAKVSSFCGLTNGAGARLTFSGSTIPTSTEVEQFITDAESEIDRRLNHAWRSTSITTEYYDYDGSGILYLNHYAIQGAFESGTDKIECWNGSSWVDLVASYTEGRGEDWFCDYAQGVIYFLAYAPLVGKDTIRLTYVYGESAVPGWITRLCNLHVAIHLASTDDYSLLFPAGTDNVPLSTKIERWQQEIERIVQREYHLTFK